MESCAIRILCFPCAHKLLFESEKGLQHQLSLHIFLKLTELRQRYTQRLYYEIRIIEPMGYSGYFLILFQIIFLGKKKCYPCRAGVQSGASSLVAFCLDIIDVDSVEVEFELILSSLNPERVSMKDIWRRFM